MVQRLIEYRQYLRLIISYLYELASLDPQELLIRHLCQKEIVEGVDNTHWHPACLPPPLFLDLLQYLSLELYSVKLRLSDSLEVASPPQIVCVNVVVLFVQTRVLQ